MCKEVQVADNALKACAHIRLYKLQPALLLNRLYRPARVFLTQALVLSVVLIDLREVSGVATVSAILRHSDFLSSRHTAGVGGKLSTARVITGWSVSLMGLFQRSGFFCFFCFLTDSFAIVLKKTHA